MTNPDSTGSDVKENGILPWAPLFEPVRFSQIPVWFPFAHQMFAK